MSDFAQYLTAPMLMILGLVVGVAVVVATDAARARSPKVRIAARLHDVLDRQMSAGDLPLAQTQADVFMARKTGLRGAIIARFDDLSANIGGPKSVRLLLILTGASGFAVAIAAPRLLPVGPLEAAIAGFAIGAIVFYVGQGEMRRRWMIGFLDQLVEAVELLTRSVRAGNAVPAAIRMVSEELGAPVGPVFGRIADEDELGIELRRSLRAAAHRVALPDFHFLAVALVIQRETGGQLGESLDNLHLVLRKRKEARLKIQALTSEGRMSAIIVGVIPFLAAGAVYFINPAQMMLLLEPGLGQTMLMIAGGLLGVGFLTVRWMVKARP